MFKERFFKELPTSRDTPMSLAMWRRRILALVLAKSMAHPNKDYAAIAKRATFKRDLIHTLPVMPREVSDIKQFIEICRRKDASCKQHPPIHPPFPSFFAQLQLQVRSPYC